MTTVTLAAAIIAVTATLKEWFPAIAGWLTILVAAVLGLVAGFAHVEGLTPITGLFAGLAASGAVHVADRVG